MNDLEYFFAAITIFATLLGAILDKARGFEVDWKANSIIGLFEGIVFSLMFAAANS